MKKIIITITAICSLSFASVYDVGDYVSETHQNITQSTCYAGNDYDVGEIISDSHQNVTQPTCFSGNEFTTGDSWKLADWNGATNGGHYTVIFIEMSATW